MSFYEKAVEALAKVDEVNGIVGGVQKFVDAETTAEKTAAAGQIAAEMAIGVISAATVRTALSGIRLGLAVAEKLINGRRYQRRWE